MVVRPSYDEIRPQFLHVKVPVHGRFISDLVPVHGRFSSHPVRFTTGSVHIRFQLTTGSGSHVPVHPVPVRFTAILKMFPERCGRFFSGFSGSKILLSLPCQCADVCAVFP